MRTVHVNIHPILFHVKDMKITNTTANISMDFKCWLETHWCTKLDSPDLKSSGNSCNKINSTALILPLWDWSLSVRTRLCCSTYHTTQKAVERSTNMSFWWPGMNSTHGSSYFYECLTRCSSSLLPSLKHTTLVNVPVCKDYGCESHATDSMWTNHHMPCLTKPPLVLSPMLRFLQPPRARSKSTRELQDPRDSKATE